jgi:pilus assembly protein Flp/PilA
VQQTVCYLAEVLEIGSASEGREEGQDLVEYALVVALIAFGAIAGMQFLASGINNAFSDIANVVTSNIT